jgi:hypothetical protein
MQIGKDPLITSGGVQFTGGTGHGKERSLDLFAGSRSITIAGSACGHDHDLGCNYLSAALREMRSRWSLGHENGERPKGQERNSHGHRMGHARAVTNI